MEQRQRCGGGVAGGWGRGCALCGVDGGVPTAGAHQPHGCGATVAGGGVACHLGCVSQGATGGTAAACTPLQPARASMQAGVPGADATPLSCPAMPRCQALLLDGHPRAGCPSTSLSTHVLTGIGGVYQVFPSAGRVAVVASPTSLVLVPHPPLAAACGCVGVAALVPPPACACCCAGFAAVAPLPASSGARTALPVQLTCPDAACLVRPPLPTALPPLPPIPIPFPRAPPQPDAPTLQPFPPANASAFAVPGAGAWAHAPPRGAGVPPPPPSADAGWPFSLTRLGDG